MQGSESKDLENRPLSLIYQLEPELFGNYPSDTFPLLIKIINAKRDLSLQVHPNDLQAKIMENQRYGKDECWLILKKSLLTKISVGVKINNLPYVKKFVLSGKAEKIANVFLLGKKRAFYIPAGTMHALKKNTIVYELQQPSDLTYRISDYGRLENGKLRTLHLEKAVKTLTPIQEHDYSLSIKELKTRPEKFGLTIMNNFDQHPLSDLTNYFVIATCLTNSGIIYGKNVKRLETFIVTNKELTTKEIIQQGKFAIA
ncbi:unnamed protein product [Didymodactylos carnosus]|uniref:Phosphomannose isomerase type I catalytic domain-containing protein n=1 Tax=Didymodactylos carnosus TaxID=1234261 RepID=A0A8S2CU41_9BILA|nr:unnamed protein product [Didymodactylos carnosus]CAF3587317.1 unnamed protein product [Didymodactylos carnosus]